MDSVNNRSRASSVGTSFVSAPNPQLGDLFVPKLERWQGAGNEDLWNALQDSFKHTPMPKDVDALKELLTNKINELLGEEINSDMGVWIREFSNGTHCGNSIDGEFWFKRVIPVLVDRLEDILEKS